MKRRAERRGGLQNGMTGCQMFANETNPHTIECGHFCLLIFQSRKMKPAVLNILNIHTRKQAERRKQNFRDDHQIGPDLILEERTTEPGGGPLSEDRVPFEAGKVFEKKTANCESDVRRLSFARR